jgi:signal transduction histidine kinase
MTDTKSKRRRGARPAVLITIGTALYFVTLALALYELDRQHYTGEKSQLIRDNFREIFDLPDNLEELGKGVLLSPAAATREAAAEHLRREFDAIVRGATSVYWLQLRDRDGTVVMEVSDPGKPQRINTFANNLFIRRFDRSTDLLIKGAGRIVGHYTSPADFEPLRRLTIRFRWVAAAITLLWLLIYHFIHKYLLRPLKRVTGYIERSRTDTPLLIPRPRGYLERSYNDIARQALLQQLQERLGGLLRTVDPAERRAVIEEALAFVEQSFGARETAAAELGRHDNDWTVVNLYQPPGRHAADAAEMAGHAARLALTEPDTAGGLRFEAPPKGGAFACLGTSGGANLIITGKIAPDDPDAQFRTECVRQACDALRGAFVTLRAFQQDMFRQRSEANIVLSRNLGHDLTNIIATNKLDLMAVRQILGMPAGDATGERAELLRQAVAGLLESTRFLQEIVNIYRSFSFVKRPQYERHDLNEIVGQFLATFEPTVSNRIELARDLAPGIPTLILEPRLLKLALFNLLTNALDAMKRDPQADGAPPRIAVATRHDPGTAGFVVTVEDNGPGIRDAEGRMMQPAEIEAIFQFGYSTKAERSEGLGLNWVRTIIEDFHAGRVAAENLHGGGARFTLVIHSMEASEAKIGGK